MQMQLEQSRALRKKMLADQATSKSKTTVSSALSLLRKDLGVLAEVLSQISWDDRHEDLAHGEKRTDHSRKTVGNALRAVNASGSEDDGVENMFDEEKTVAGKLGLGQDAVHVDLLLSLIER
eukprot:CAMPEP_0197567644 /NCGR_PEP_ID=MMETSP1320-20131121/35940_1 /TAXON_ID=91990 /ORGANISM="Bolidomonas sp., Strain RCC2347" /LENGTH=121 /DNA_ID=CAMNT_0043129855 /DNA_START=295 /DNA_END=656 /DNA_ORIENTATION=+